MQDDVKITGSEVLRVLIVTHKLNGRLTHNTVVIVWIAAQHRKRADLFRPRLVPIPVLQTQFRDPSPMPLITALFGYAGPLEPHLLRQNDVVQRRGDGLDHDAGIDRAAEVSADLRTR